MIWSLWHLFQPIKMKKKRKSRFPFRSSNFICVTIKTVLSILKSSYVAHKLITNFRQLYVSHVGMNHSSAGQESACNAGHPGSIAGLGRSTGEGNGNPLQYSCLENPMDRGACQATVHGVTRVRQDLVTKPPLPPLMKEK